MNQQGPVTTVVRPPVTTVVRPPVIVVVRPPPIVVVPIQLIPNITVQTATFQIPQITVQPISHSVYVLKSLTTNRAYVGYTVDFQRRLRQHNGEIAGGAKKTSKDKPWTPVCIISGFTDNHCALRFEFRLQHLPGRKRSLDHILRAIPKIIAHTDQGRPWPILNIQWYPH